MRNVSFLFSVALLFVALGANAQFYVKSAKTPDRTKELKTYEKVGTTTLEVEVPEKLAMETDRVVKNDTIYFIEEYMDMHTQRVDKAQYLEEDGWYELKDTYWRSMTFDVYEPKEGGNTKVYYVMLSHTDIEGGKWDGARQDHSIKRVKAELDGRPCTARHSTGSLGSSPTRAIYYYPPGETKLLRFIITSLPKPQGGRGFR